ncbi:hypothetical protein D3C86_1914030 [compost metagenome]
MSRASPMGSFTRMVRALFHAICSSTSTITRAWRLSPRNRRSSATASGAGGMLRPAKSMPRVSARSAHAMLPSTSVSLNVVRSSTVRQEERMAVA